MGLIVVPSSQGYCYEEQIKIAYEKHLEHHAAHGGLVININYDGYWSFCSFYCGGYDSYCCYDYDDDGVDYKLAIAIGTYHLPLQGLNHELLQLLSFNTPWKQFRVESRDEALCALGKTGRTGLQIVRYFQELILWAQFFYLPISRKALKSFMVTTAPHD